MAEVLLAHLKNSKVEESTLRNDVIPVLMEKGCRKVADLEFLEEEDLESKFKESFNLLYIIRLYPD